VGGHVVEYLFRQGEISKGTFRKGAHLKIMDSCGVQGVDADLLDHHSLHEAMEGVDTVYNLASPMPGEDQDHMRVNQEGLLNMLEVSAEAGVRTFVHLSTLDVCGFGGRHVTASSPPSPAGDYQKGKAAAEKLLVDLARRQSAPRVVIVRSARAVGSRDASLTVPLLRMARSGRVVLPASLPMSFTHPQDIAQAMYKAATGSSPTGSVFLVKSFDASPDELARAIIASVGGRAEVRKEGLLSKSSLPTYTAAQLRAALTIDPQPSWAGLGYAPAMDLGATCNEIAAWYRKDPWVADEA